MRKNLVLTPLMIALVSGAAYTQDTSNAILTGRVTTQAGNAPLAGVRVLIQSPSLLGQRQTTTGADGNFRVPLLPNGEYTVTYSLNGYLTRRLTMRLVAGQTSNASIRLTAVEVQETVVEIEAEPQRILVDKTDTIVQTALSGDFLEKLGGRNMNMLINIAPGLADADLSRGMNIRGGTYNSTKFLVNGVNTTEMYGGYVVGTFNMSDLIESVSVIQSPLNARYGNTDGGIISTVTSRGTNEFKGTIRTSLWRSPGWGAMDIGYPNRSGRFDNISLVGTDVLSKNYEVSVTGPIWKDRVTFAYGAKLSPKSYGKKAGSDLSNLWTAAEEEESVRSTGIFYKHLDPTYGRVGDEIRKAELLAVNTIDSYLNTSSQSTYNQFAVYFQITPDHQLEYNYSDSEYSSSGMSGSWENNPEFNKQGQTSRSWNIAYKGIIGSSGVLDVRYGKNNQSWWFGDGKTFPIESIAYQAYIPRDGSTYPDTYKGNDPHKLDSYWQNSFFGRLVGPAWRVMIGTGDLPGFDAWFVDYPGDPAGQFNYWLSNVIGNPRRGARFPMGGGPNDDIGDGGGITSLSFNYQHLLSTGKGTHMIDIGMQSEKADWLLKRNTAPFKFTVAGQIAYNLSPLDIYNPDGGATGSVNDYRGKYIVFNVAEATFYDIDPWTVNRMDINRNARFLTPDPNRPGFYRTYGPENMEYNPASPNAAGNGIPRMIENYGESDGNYNSNMVSYYINDLWSIDDNHSVQAGLRYDVLDSYDRNRKFVSYSMPTLRFEYKWDIFGDQSRLFNASWGQFHSWQPMQVFTPLASGRLDNTRVAYWNKGTPTQYLVSREEVVDPSNYTAWTFDTKGSASGDYFRMDKNWKAPISTEVSVGMRRNLPNGGFYKITYSYRNSTNQWDWYVDDPYYNDAGNLTYVREMPDGSKTYMAVAKNSSGHTRYYSGLELEWDYPIHKRVLFGGSYTFSRLMSNAPGKTEAPSRESNPAMNQDDYWDYLYDGSREAWNPVHLRNPEHSFKFYFLFDFSSGNVGSSLSLTGNYTSGAPRQDYIWYLWGFPKDFYPELLNSYYNNGSAGTGVIGANRFEDDVVVPFNTARTGDDNWSLDVRYSLTVPLIKKLTWLVNIDISNPFNYRGVGADGWFNGTSGQPPDSIIMPNNPAGLNPVKPWGNGWYSSGEWQNLYRQRMAGREIYVETGLRF